MSEVYIRLNDGRYIDDEHAEKLIGELQARLDRIRELTDIGVDTDGAHHKQWALAQIALEFGRLDTEPGIAP